MDAPGLPALRGLENCPGLRKLDLRRTESLTELPEAGSLTELSLSHLPWPDLSPLTAHPSLRKLELGTMEKLTDISALTALPALAEIDFIDLPLLTDTGPLLDVESLRRVKRSRQMRAQALSDRPDPVLAELETREVTVDWH
ncbi:hypothetical protein [Streptomyces sp. ISL-12]|uniref:hypothetical protein n=1 Tax=Streptomyces sp. ISL-12 TaxID=2819177 RepID=UPI002035B0A4|nr:hypothetical protein [Streptomyces sp. ISL-12]